MATVDRVGAFAEVVVAHVKAQALDVAGKIITNQLFIGNINVAKRLQELSAKVEVQEKELQELRQTVEELKKR